MRLDAMSTHTRQVCNEHPFKDDYLFYHLLGRSPTMHQLHELDAEYANALQWTLHNDITGIIFETFTVTQEVFGETREVPLVPGGADIEVTEENKAEYVQQLLAWRTGGSVQRQLDALVEGFRELVPADAVRIFSPMQLQLLLKTPLLVF